MSKNKSLEKQLDYTFSDPDLLELALTHRSHNKSNNERLEFLGDALLDLIISEALYMRYPHAHEGQMTRTRASLVKGETLADIAREIQLGDYLKLGSGELKSGGHRRASILADALEAIFGAVYIDSDLENCRTVIMRLYADRFNSKLLESEEKDPKTQLQEWMQARKKRLPVYSVVTEVGEAQEKLFTVKCSVGSICDAETATGESKRAAEMAAAEKVLILLNKQDP
jgi:ribonuclease-3